jgi:6,7-dimethyl-8-ribityllumazine synthase
MAKFEHHEVAYQVEGARFALAASRFNEDIVARLLDGAVDTLNSHGIETEAITIVRVPGAFELPLAVKRLAASGRFDAIIALGAVIRGATPHFEYVAGECARGLGRVALELELPVAFGVLTVDTMEQALTRANGDEGNKGREAALAALEMVSLLRTLD